MVSRRRRTRARDIGNGFTLIELMIVIAIIAIIAAIAIPNLLDARKSGNESSAIGTLRTLVSSQSLFRDRDVDGDGVYDYADSLAELAQYDLIDDVLGAGTKQGYYFTMNPAPDRYSWEVTADPESPGRTGDQSFIVDETGVIGTRAPACPPGYKLVIDENGQPNCVPDILVVSSSALGAALGAAAAETLTLLTPEEVLEPAKKLVKGGTLGGLVLLLLDADGDGWLTFGETLEVDIFSLARSLGRGQSDGRTVVDDSAVKKVIAEFQGSLKDTLALGADETELPAVQISGLQGSPLAVLELAADDPRFACLHIEQSLLQHLEASDMEGSAASGEQRRRELIDAGDELHELLRFDRTKQLQQRLDWIRRNALAWVTSPKDEKIAARANQCLGLIGGSTRD